MQDLCAVLMHVCVCVRFILWLVSDCHFCVKNSFHLSLWLSCRSVVWCNFASVYFFNWFDPPFSLLMTLITKTWHTSTLQESNNLFYSFISSVSPQTPSCCITIWSLFDELWIQAKAVLKEGEAGLWCVHKTEQTEAKNLHNLLISKYAIWSCPQCYSGNQCQVSQLYSIFFSIIFWPLNRPFSTAQHPWSWCLNSQKGISISESIHEYKKLKVASISPSVVHRKTVSIFSEEK